MIDGLYEINCECVNIGEDILDSFYNGNFTEGIASLYSVGATAVDLAEYYTDYLEETGSEPDKHFDFEFWTQVGDAYNDYRRHALD